MSAQLAQSIKEAAAKISEEVAKNCGSVPQLTFPHIYLGLQEFAASLAAHEAAPQQEPVAWVDERAIAWLEGRSKTASITTQLQAHKSAARPMALYAAPQQAQAPGWQRSQHDADSAELRSLCKDRDEARRERDMLRAELAGHEASSGHLSAMVDELRALLAEAMAMMKALHESASPDDGPEMNAIVSAGADVGEAMAGGLADGVSDGK
tara:strand:- start:23 stop:649 length:627 start_codon:yes stop_codon:yes gene_type:complete